MKRIEKKLVKVVRDKEVTIIRGENDSLKALMIIGKAKKKEVPTPSKKATYNNANNYDANITVSEYAVLDDSICKLLKANKVKHRQVEIAKNEARCNIKRERRKALLEARRYQDTISLLTTLFR